jgi:D-alanine-D-alanine ligase
VSGGGNLGKVAVLMGGTSAEREISLLSGKAVLAALLDRGVDAHAFDPAVQPIWEIKREGFDRAFIILHGRHGEDGSIQGALEVMGVPYTGSGVMASALAMDKWRTKLVWQATGVPTPRFRVLTPDTDLAQVADDLGLPLIVKPAREGSSIGVGKVEAMEDFGPAFDAAYRLDPLVIAEEFVVGQELTAAVLDDIALPLVRIEAPDGKYDYQNKYFTDEVRYHCPAGLPAALEAEIGRAMLHAFQVLGCRSWGRGDVILRPDNSFTLLEMNTAPGMTSHSLVPMAARAAGIDFPDLVLRVLGGASLG